MTRSNRYLPSLLAVLAGAGAIMLISIADVGAQSVAAERHMARGMAAMQLAETPAEFRDAVKEFREATKLAPGWADAWFNLGVAQESAEDYAGAMRSFKTYLEKNPQAADRKAVERRIFGLEYKQERQAQLSREEPAKRDAPSLTGTWIQSLAGSWDNSCAHRGGNPDNPHQLRITADGLLEMRWWSFGEWTPWWGEHYGWYFRYDPAIDGLRNDPSLVRRDGTETLLGEAIFTRLAENQLRMLQRFATGAAYDCVWTRR